MKSGARTKVLFICSRNQWRSPTAEALFKNSQTVDARSAGTSPKARVRVTDKHVRWADMIFAMERHHSRLLLERLYDDLDGKRIIVLDIPDEYQFMDDALIDLLRDRLAPYLDLTE